jgi:hypothetical protein
MKKYKLFIRGQNFSINLDGEIKKLGFYTTRFVEACDEREAEDLVIELLRQDSSLLETVKNDKSDLPMMHVERIEELDSFEGCFVPGAGFTFYPEAGHDE